MKAVIYVRVSTAEQVENFSLESQQHACEEFCDREGMSVARVFVEEGESAKTADRPRLQEALEFCRAHRKEIDNFVVYNVSRFARNMADHTALRLALNKLGIRLRAASEQFDDTASGKLVENMLAVIAQFDNDQRAAGTIAGMKTALAKGRWTHQPPLGYRKPIGKAVGAPSLVPDPERAPLIQLAFERMSTGRFSKAQLLRELTTLGLLTKKGTPLPAQSFGSILRNRIYAGWVVVPKWGIESPGDFEALVSEPRFEAVQAILSHRKPSVLRRHRNHPDFPLRRLVRCGACQAPYTGSYSKGRTKRYAYYRCPNRNCHVSNVAKEKLEADFRKELASLSVRPEVVDLFGEVVRDVWRDRHAVSLDRKKRLGDQLRDIATRKDRVVDAYLHKDSIDKRTYTEQCERLDGERHQVQAQIATAEPEHLDLDGALSFARKILTDLAGCWERLSPAHRPNFQRAVYPNGLHYLDGFSGTAKSSWAFGYFGAANQAKDGMVSLSSSDWNHVLDWLVAVEELRQVVPLEPHSALVSL